MWRSSGAGTLRCYELECSSDTPPITHTWFKFCPLASRVGHQVLVLPADVTIEAQLNAAVQECARTFGRINIAVLNVGINTLQSAAFGDVAVLDRVLDVNLRSCVHCTRAVLPHLLESKLDFHRVRSDEPCADKGATLVFISSQIALMYALAPGHAAYIASKAGLSGFADGVFAEVR